MTEHELDTLLPMLEGLRLEYPVFVDVEASSLQSLGRTELTNLVRFAMDILDQKGWFPGFYTYTNFAQNYLNMAELAAYPLWIADYRGCPRIKWRIWQHTDSHSLPGIRGKVDRNVFAGSEQEFKKLIL